MKKPKGVARKAMVYDPQPQSESLIFAHFQPPEFAKAD
jgi:hypothetical protein